MRPSAHGSSPISVAPRPWIRAVMPFAAALIELGPAGEALVGGDLQEGIGVPAAVGVEILELDDLHFLPRKPGNDRHLVRRLGAQVALTRQTKLCHGSRATPTAAE